MLKQHKEILAAVIRDLRRDLLGATEKDGTPVRGDLDRELERLGVLPDGRVQPIDALPGATPADVRAHESAERFIEAARRQGRPAAQARAEFVEQAAYSWLNRLVALRALEARRLINGTLRPNDDYGGVSEAIYLLAQTNPARVAAPDGGWWEVLDQACTAQAQALPGLFGAGDPVLTLRPSVPALRRCVERIGRGPTFADPEATDTAFADPDAIGWAYQFYQEEAKAAAFASFKAGKKADSRATIAAATQLFTEPYMVKWLLQNSLGRSYHEMYPDSALPASWEYYIRPTEERPLGQPAPAISSLELLTVLDPCVGSGHFLREAFDLLAAMYREQHPDWEARRIAETILHNHLHGIDIDPRAVQLAALTLYMRALDLLRDEARARRRPMPHWTPTQINLATTPSGLDAGALERHLARHPEDVPLRPVLERIFESLGQAELLGSLLRPGAEIDAAIATFQAPQQTIMFGETTDTTQAPMPDIRAIRAIRGSNPAALKQLVLNQVAQSFRDEAASPDAADALFGREAERGVRLLQLLDRKYAVVVTNPPYMGSSNMPGPLKKYVKQNYNYGKRDLYAAFILRCSELTVIGGRSATVTLQSYLSIASYSNLRNHILKHYSIEALASLGRHAFTEADPPGNPVLSVICAGIWKDGKFYGIRINTPMPAEEQAKLLLKLTNLQMPPLSQLVQQSRFLGIDENILCFWLPNSLISILAGNSRVQNIANPRAGLTTGDSPRYYRFFWEINEQYVDRWYPIANAGGYSRWFGLNNELMRFDEGHSVVLSNTGNNLPSREFYGRVGVELTQGARGSLSARLFSGAAFSNSSLAVFPKGETSVYQLLWLLNSYTLSYFLRAICHKKFGFETGHVRALPVPKTNFLHKDQVSYVVKLKKMILSALPHEKSFAFRIGLELLLIASAHQSTVETMLEKYLQDELVVLHESQTIFNETGTPAGFHPLIAGYDALPELPAELELPELPGEVLEYLERHERISPAPAELARIKARLGQLYAAGPGAKDDGADDEANEAADDDEDAGAVDGTHIPIPTETFLEELSVKMELHPISVYWLLEELRAAGARCLPEERRLLEDRLSVLVLRLLGHRWPKQIEAGEPPPAWADADGIIPLVNLGTGDATLAARLRARLREEDGDMGAQRTEALLSELTGATSLEDWCARLFWPRHVRQFKARPVAWQLASRPAGSGKKRGTRQTPLFECMLYYHATGGDALARLRTQYVEPLLRREESALGEALGARNSEAAASANARVEELREFLNRLQQVENQGFACAELDALLTQEPLDRWSGDGIAAPDDAEALARQERAWRVDLNDGVRVNIAPLQLAGVLAGDVLKAADAKKALADRARWRADERRWVRAGKLPRCGWMDENVPESPAWTRLAPERAAEQRKLEEKRRAAQAGPTGELAEL